MMILQCSLALGRGHLQVWKLLNERNLHKRVAQARQSPWESEVRTVHTFQSENVAQSQQTIARPQLIVPSRRSLTFSYRMILKAKQFPYPMNLFTYPATKNQMKAFSRWNFKWIYSNKGLPGSKSDHFPMQTAKSTLDFLMIFCPLSFSVYFAKTMVNTHCQFPQYFPCPPPDCRHKLLLIFSLSLAHTHTTSHHTSHRHYHLLKRELTFGGNMRDFWNVNLHRSPVKLGGSPR